MLPFSRRAPGCSRSSTASQLDDLARRRLRARDPRRDATRRAPSSALEIGEDGEPQLRRCRPSGTRARARVQAPARGRSRSPGPGRFFVREAAWGVAVPADPALRRRARRVRGGAPEGAARRARRAMLDELRGGARARGGHRGALLRRGRRAGRAGAGRRAAPVPARRRALRARAPAHVHRRRAGARQDRPGAGHAGGRRGVPGGRGVPGEHEARRGSARATTGCPSARVAVLDGRTEAAWTEEAAERRDRGAELRHPRGPLRAPRRARGRARWCWTSRTT